MITAVGLSAAETAASVRSATARFTETSLTQPLDGPLFLQRLALQVGGGFDVKRSDASHRGRAGGLTAIGQAAEMIRTGQTQFVLAGGIDTYRDLYVLGTLDMEQRVK